MRASDSEEHDTSTVARLTRDRKIGFTDIWPDNISSTEAPPFDVWQRRSASE